MSIKEIQNLIAEVDGWLSVREGKLLYSLAKNCKGKGVIVEIGSWKGKSTVCLAKGSEEGNKLKVYAIDPHTGSLEHNSSKGRVWTFDEFSKNIRGSKIKKRVVPIVKTSNEASKNFNKPIEFIFIDGAHEYEFVKMDFDLWFPKVIDGGIMAFHDTLCWDGPKKLVEEKVYKSHFFRNVSFVDSITFAQKVSKNSGYDRLRNRFFLLLKKVYELTGNLKVKLKRK